MPILMTIDLWQFIGLIGAAIYIAMYAAVACDRLSARRPVFFGGNLIAASLVLLSATQTLNTASALLQFFYIAVSLVGLHRHLGIRRAERRLAKTDAACDQTQHA